MKLLTKASKRQCELSKNSRDRTEEKKNEMEEKNSLFLNLQPAKLVHSS